MHIDRRRLYTKGVTNMRKHIIDIETNGLEPVKEDHRILAIGLDGDVIMHREEKRVLEEFWSRLEGYSQLVGFNIDEFDIRFILVRSVKHRVPVKRFTTLDLRKVLANRQYRVGGTLSDYCRVLGVEDGDKLTGAEMVDAGRRWLQGDEEGGNLIRSHLRWDLCKTSELHDLLVDMGLVAKVTDPLAAGRPQPLMASQ